MADKLPFGEGASINRPPLFCGVNYQFWKVRMKIFIHSTDKGIWEAIENGPFIPQVKKDDVFVGYHNAVKQKKCGTFLRSHMRELMMYKGMQKGETIFDVQKRFSHTVNHLMSLGKSFDKEELNIKILKCLDRSWQPKVTTISESKDLTSMTTTSLFSKLREHEFEMNRLVVQESEDEHNKGIALKDANQKRQQDSSDGQSLKRYSSKKLNDFNPNKYICYDCGEKGHIKAECPNNESKEKANFKGERREKTKKAYITWDDNEVSSSSSSDDAEANLCLKGSTSSSMSSSSSVKGNNYYQLLEAFNETHEEADRLALSNNRLKGLNNWLENRVKTLEEELEKSKVDFENLDLIYKNSACMCDSNFCENCENLEKKIHYLLKTVDRLTTGKSNFENVLAYQNCVFGKAGLGFYPQSRKNGISKPFSSVLENQSIKRTKQPVVTYFYCMKRGHSVRFFMIRKSLVPKGPPKARHSRSNSLLAVELSEFDVQYEPQGLIKGQVYPDFMVELSSEGPQTDPNDFQWVLSVDGS
ncbi:uncharacterized protein [Phaseolus vulgaris]|uniref:uncharacterized protein n=1 Tax=Phaseolus vulgaris TaxID=3885 RepID=UPI0035CBB8B4